MTQLDESSGGIFYPDSRKPIIFVLIIYCVSGTLLLLVNKILIYQFSCPNTLLAFQNTLIIMCLILSSHIFPQKVGSIPSLKMHIIKWWLPLVLCFVVVLISSLICLLYVSIYTVVLITNISTVLVATLEYIVISQQHDRFSVMVLISMIFGIIFFPKENFSSDVIGYLWLFGNILATSLYKVFLKKIVKSQIMGDIGTIGKELFKKNVDKN